MDVARIASQLAGGLITEDFVRRTYGDDFLTQVLAFGVGGLLGGAAYDVADDLTDGLLSDAFEMDDLF